MKYALAFTAAFMLSFSMHEIAEALGGACMSVLLVVFGLIVAVRG